MSSSKEQAEPVVSFHFLPLIEFFTALYRVANRDLFEGKSMEWHIAADDQSGKFLAHMKQGLSPFLNRELTFFFGIRHPSVNQAFHELAFLHPNVRTIEELLVHIEMSPPSQIIQCMCEDVPENSIRSELASALTAHDADVLLERSSEVSEFLASPDGANIAECLANPHEANTRFAFLLRGFYERAFAPVEAELKGLSMQAIPKFEQIYSQDANVFYSKFVQTDSSTFKKRVVVHVSAIHPLGISSTLTDAADVPDYVRLGMLTDLRLRNKGNDEEAEQFSKAIADKRRLEIIQLLSRRQWYGQELARHLDLTSAAVSYHMTFLFALDLVTFQKLDHRVYYELNQERLKELLDRLQNLLLPHGADG